jgi:hypothetical protein
MTAFTTFHPIRQNVLGLEQPVREVNQAVRGLRGLTLLLDGYEQSEIDPMYVLALLDPIERNLRETAENLDARFSQTQDSMRAGDYLPGDNDRRLCVLEREYAALQPQVRSEIASERTDGPALQRQFEIVEEMTALPADTVVGIAAKLAVGHLPEGEPETAFEKLEHRALKEIERLGGFDPKTREA